MTDEVMTTGDVARELRVCEDTVRKLAARGELTYRRTPSGFRLFDPAEVRRLAEQRRQQRGASGQ